MSENVIIALISALSGGVIGQFFNFLLSSKKQHSDDYISVMELWKQDNERLRKIESDLRAEVDKLRDMVSDLGNKVVLLESSHLSFPFPMWLKGLDGRMLVVNSAYESLFLSPRGFSADDYVGEMDSAVWSEDVCALFKENDLRALTSESGYYRVMQEVSGVKYVVFLYVRKWDKRPIGIGGVALKIDEYVSG